MDTKVFLDTNVVIDFFDPLRKEHQQARDLFTLIENNETLGFVSETVLNTAVYILRKQFSVAELKEILVDFLSIVFLLPCSNKSYLQCLKAAGNDIEDALLYQLALENNLDYFITEDKRGFKKILSRELPVVTTREFLNINR